MKLVGYLLFGIVYTFIYVVLAGAATGGGHGNFIVLIPMIPWIFNFVALILLTKLKSEIVRICFVVLMLMYYGFNALILYPASQDIEMVTYPHAESIFIPAAWFLLGQVGIWVLFFREIRNRKIDDLDQRIFPEIE